jgi:GH24 family phage-related lysozyme (muramidase)
MLGIEDKVSVDKKLDREVASETQPVQPVEPATPQYPVPAPKPSGENLSLKDRIKQYENPFKEGYDPKTGLWTPHASPEGGAPTVAWGDKLLKGKYAPEVVQKITTKGITDQEADQMLEANINKAKQDALDIIRQKGIADLSPQQQEALTEMVFQMGRSGVSKFNNMLDSLKYGDYDRAYDEALDSLWAKQTPQRAKEVAERLKFPKVKRYIYKK